MSKFDFCHRFIKNAPIMDVHKLIQFFSDLIYIYILLYVTLSVKVLKKSMASSLVGSNRRMMLRSSSKLFWNGVPDRIIRLLVRISAKAFQIAIFGRLLLNFVPKSELFYRELRSKTTLKSFVPLYACHFRLMLKSWFS